MRVDVYAIHDSDQFLVRLGFDIYRMTKNADDPVNAGQCVFVNPASSLPSHGREVDVVPIGIVKQIAYILRRDTAIRVTKALEELTEYLDDDGLRSNLKG